MNIGQFFQELYGPFINAALFGTAQDLREAEQRLNHIREFHMLTISLPLIVTNLAIEAALKALSHVGHDVNWTQVKIAFDADVRAFVPGERIDDVCVRAANTVIDAVAKAVQDEPDIEAIIKDLAAKNWAGARDALVALVTKSAGTTLGHILAA